MRLKEYRRRRMLNGGMIDPTRPGGWAQTRNAGKFGTKIYQSPWSPNIPQTKLGNGLKTLNPLTNPLERVNKLSDVGEGLKSAKQRAPFKIKANKLPALSKMQRLLKTGIPTALGGMAIHEARKGSIYEGDIEAAPYEEQGLMGKLQYDIMNLFKDENETEQSKEPKEYIRPSYAKKGLDDNMIPHKRNYKRGDGSLLMAGQNIPEATQQEVMDEPTPSTPRTSTNNVGTGKVGNSLFSSKDAIGKADIPSVSVGSNMNNPDVNTVSDAELEAMKSRAANPSVEPEAGGANWSNIAQVGLQFLPDAINLATGLFGKDKTPKATRVNRSAASKMPAKYNINPMLQSNASSYRAILSDPNATTNQKLAALTMKQQADQQAYAEKINKENMMKSDRARIEASLDSQQAQYDNQYRQDKMQSDANFGLTGNFTRQSLQNMSVKGLQMLAQKAQKENNKKELALILSSVDEAVQERILNALDNG